MSKIQLEGYRCERCTHQWAPRNTSAQPRVCPKCHSAYWNVPRKESGIAAMAGEWRPKPKPSEAEKEKALIEYGQILSHTDVSEKQREIMLEQWREKHRGWFEHMPK